MSEAEDYIEDKVAEAARYLERQAKLGRRKAESMAGNLADEAKDRFKEGHKKVTRMVG